MRAKWVGVSMGHPNEARNKLIRSSSNIFRTFFLSFDLCASVFALWTAGCIDPICLFIEIAFMSKPRQSVYLSGFRPPIVSLQSAIIFGPLHTRLQLLFIDSSSICQIYIFPSHSPVA